MGTSIIVYLQGVTKHLSCIITNFAKKNENLYKSAEKSYNALMRSLTEERKIVTNRYNEFIKVKK